MRTALGGTAVAVLVWAALVVPLPLAVTTPSAVAVSELIGFDDELPGELPGQLHVTVVRLEQATLAATARSVVADERQLTLPPALLSSEMDDQRYQEFQRESFRESVQAAVAVGLDTAGLEVTIDGDGARVVATVPGTPGADAFEPDDVITEVAGQDVALASELAARLADRQVGQQVRVTARRDDGQLTQPVELVGLEGEPGRAGLGVLVTTVDRRIETPVRAHVRADRRVGGPSAGLVLALGAYDTATETTLGGGRVIAGTGTIDLAGNVGPVAGIAAKVRGAMLIDAEVLLVPDSQLDQARGVAPPELEVVGVATLSDAIDELTD